MRLRRYGQSPAGLDMEEAARPVEGTAF